MRETEQTRGRQSKWDRRNLRTVSTHVTTREAEALRRICGRRGTTPYALLRRFVRQVIRQWG